VVKWEEVNSEARLRRRDVGMDFCLTDQIAVSWDKGKAFCCS